MIPLEKEICQNHDYVSRFFFSWWLQEDDGFELIAMPQLKLFHEGESSHCDIDFFFQLVNSQSIKLSQISGPCYSIIKLATIYTLIVLLLFCSFFTMKEGI